MSGKKEAPRVYTICKMCEGTGILEVGSMPGNIQYCPNCHGVGARLVDRSEANPHGHDHAGFHWVPRRSRKFPDFINPRRIPGRKKAPNK